MTFDGGRNLTEVELIWREGDFAGVSPAISYVMPLFGLGLDRIPQRRQLRAIVEHDGPIE
jgi:hypothetical protein